MILNKNTKFMKDEKRCVLNIFNVIIDIPRSVRTNCSYIAIDANGGVWAYPEKPQFDTDNIGYYEDQDGSFYLGFIRSTVFSLFSLKVYPFNQSGIIFNFLEHFDERISCLKINDLILEVKNDTQHTWI